MRLTIWLWDESQRSYRKVKDQFAPTTESFNIKFFDGRRVVDFLTFSNNHIELFTFQSV